MQLYMSRAAESSARDVLDTVPLVMQFIRDRIRLQRTAGLSVLQFRTLAFLSRVRKASLSTVADHAGLSLPAMSRMMNGLVKSGLVERQTVATNRQIALTLTAKGRTTREKMRDGVRKQLADSLKTLSTAEQKVIQEAMQSLHRVFDTPVPGET